ncbi:hypothetical protein L7F22_000246 [Adiantum nelumboides]|nr:hypothetical protein [Adiantum nelumboides]
MRDTSTWAGHMELQVISLVTHTNICIHRLLSPRWHINTFASTSVRCIHLSYHNGEHYNSVRRIDDSGGGPAKLILLETPVLEERKDGKGKAACKRYSFKNQTQQKAEAPVVEAQTIEKDDDAENVCNFSGSELEPDVPLKLIGSENREDVSPESQNRTSGQVQKVARNKACPCGSKKKYKACCGAVMSKHRAQEMACSSTEVLSNKARKQNLRNNKGGIYPLCQRLYIQQKREGYSLAI